MRGSKKTKGVVAAGHAETAKAAATLLEEGGNAFDAALAALCAACVVEPVFASLGGGGFLLARPAGAPPVVYDFFAHTPKVRKADVDFYPVIADFGTAQQEFHIGMGAVAVPGVVKGLFEIHRDLGSLPMARIVEPAAALARNGFAVSALQAYVFTVAEKIYNCNEACLATYGSRKAPGRLMVEGEVLAIPGLAEMLEALAREGDGLFYRGALARQIATVCRDRGGHLTERDLEAYRVVKRVPLVLDYRGTRIMSNPPPSTGGILIAFALELIKDAGLADLRFGSAGHLDRLVSVMALTNKARIESRLHEAGDEEAARTLLDPDFIAAYRRQVLGRPEALSGTTHISVIDGLGNSASLSSSNGEGSGQIVPGTGMMLNNMLGEEDINPLGFQRWPEDVRLCSMMAPSLVVWPEGREAALGSGGSKRLRTAILQVLVNLLDFAMPVEEAVRSPRLHFEDGELNIESGFDPVEVGALIRAFPETKVWGEINFFFGGVHTALFDPAGGRFEGAGDPRRAGSALSV